jgi:glutathione S-transferase
VLVTAAILDVPLDLEVVNAQASEHRTPEYMRLNPNALFPTLKDDDFILWESNAITQYIASKKPGNSLWPEDGRLRADITRWQSWELAHWGPASRPYIWENYFKALTGAGAPDPDELQRAEPQFRRFAGLLDAHLVQRDWLVGNTLTLADITVASLLMYRSEAKFPLAGFANLDRWFAAIERLPAWQETSPPIAERIAA